MASPRKHHSSLQSRPLASRKCLDSADSIDEKATVSVANPLSTARPGRKQMAAGGVPKVSVPHQQGFKNGTLAIPSRLARDSSQAYLRDRAGLAHGQQ